MDVSAKVAVIIWAWIGALRFAATLANQRLPSNNEPYLRARHVVISLIGAAAVGAVACCGTLEVVSLIAKAEPKILAASLPGSK